MNLYVALAIGGPALVSAGWLHYLWLIPKERVPVAPHAHRIAMFIGAGSSIAAIAIAPHSVVTWALALASVPLAAFFFYLLARARQPAATPTFAVGQPLPAISATGETDNAWTSAELAGKRALIKLFRGHW